MKDSPYQITINTPTRSSNHSPYQSTPSDLLKSTALSQLKSKRHSQPNHSKLEIRESNTKSLSRPTRAESTLDYTAISKPEILIFPENLRRNSNESPDWFKISVPQCRQNNDDGNISVLSKLNGWIHVSEDSKSRMNRVGKKGPFDAGEFNLHKVSQLAPSWMKGARRRGWDVRVESPAFCSMNKEEKRRFLFKGSEEVDVRRKEDKPKAVEKGINYRPRIFYEWIEPGK